MSFTTYQATIERFQPAFRVVNLGKGVGDAVIIGRSVSMLISF